MNDTTEAQPESAPAEDYVREQVKDALELANFAVSSGAKGTEEQELLLADVATIQSTAAKVGLIAIPIQPSETLTLEKWNAFEEAYHRVAVAMSPVTAQTLRDTRDTARAGKGSGRTEVGSPRVRDRVYGWVWGYSPAQQFTREVWFLAFFFAVAIVALESFNYALGLKKDAASVATCRFIVQALVPWAYGGLGACAYLLRSAHEYIYKRTFDTRRTPEYFNRILLGAISGGTIALFTEYLGSGNGNDDGTGGVHLSAAALGFVAGYSGDLLFKLVERVIKAIFPNDDGSGDDKDSDTKAPPPRQQNTEKPPGGGQNNQQDNQQGGKDNQGGGNQGQGGADPAKKP